MQSKEKLTRKIETRVKQNDLEIFELNKDKILKLNEPLYGSWNVDDYWGVTSDKHINKKLGMTPTPVDTTLYVEQFDERL